MNAVKKQLLPLSWMATISFFTWLMLRIVLPYSSGEWNVDFLATKQLIIHLDYYRYSFYAHISSSLIILFSGVFLFVDVILRNYPLVHRWVGKTYVFLLLLIAAPSGFVMAFYANGGWIAKVSFLILTPLWWWVTFKGLQTARQQNFKAHQLWMMRSYALTLSAVTLRLFQLVLSNWFYMDPVTQYILVSWGSWIFNLVIAECLIWRKRNRFTSNMSHANHG